VVYQPLNTIIFSGTSSEIDGLVKIAEALDKQVEQEETEGITAKGNIHVIHLQNADATQLSEVLSRVPFSETAKIETTRCLLPRLRMIKIARCAHQAGQSA
jgi:hypothetical protein